MQSEAGSPTAGVIDGAQLALKMIEAAESAAAAAKAAATRPESRDDWYKMLPKLAVLNQRIVMLNLVSVVTGGGVLNSI